MSERFLPDITWPRLSWWTKVRLWFRRAHVTVDPATSYFVVTKRLNGVVYVMGEGRLK